MHRRTTPPRTSLSRYAHTVMTPQPLSDQVLRINVDLVLRRSVLTLNPYTVFVMISLLRDLATRRATASGCSGPRPLAALYVSNM